MTTPSKTLNINATLTRAKSHAKKGQLSEAKELYHIVLAAFPQNQQAKKGLKALQKDQVNKNNPSGPPQVQLDSVIALYSQGQIQKTLSALETLIKDYPNTPLLYNISGVCYQALGQFETAVKSYEQALAIKPDYADAYSNLGITFHELGQLEAAVKNFEQALAIKPDFAEAHSNFGNTLKELGQLEAAIKSYEQALAIKPDIAEVHSNLGNTLKELGQLEAAIKSYEQALAIKPDNADAYCNLGITFHELDQLDAAVKSYKQALAIKPDFAEAHNNLGATLKELGKLEAAIKSYEQALAIKPDYADAYCNLGITFHEFGQLEAAIKSYEQALAIKPDFAEAHNNLGATFKELGQLNAAVKSYKQALAIKPDYADAYSNLGITFHELGQLDAAVKNLEQALAINPLHQLSNYQLARIFLTNRNFIQAINYFQASQHMNWEENILLCLYKLKRFEEFKNKLIQVVSRSKPSNSASLLNALSVHYSYNFGIENPYNFCPNPLDFIFQTQVPELLNDNFIFVNELLRDIFTLKIDTRIQDRLKFGTQSSGNLLKREEVSFKKLSTIIKALIHNYYMDHRNIENDFIRLFPENIEFSNSWYIRMKKGGHLNSHLHENAWISGAVYLSIPEQIKNSNEGAIELSIDGDNYPRLQNQYTKRIIKLNVGDIVFFPSSLFHRTIPFDSNEERICIAFDVSV